MKLKGKTIKPDGTEVECWAEIAHISIVGDVASYGVCLYYYDGEKKVDQPIDNALTKRYSYPLEEKKGDIYETAYNKLLLEPKFKDFVITEVV